MSRQNINRICSFVPVALSLTALTVVLVAVTFGWGKGQSDEGVAAHIFQLMIVLQIPFILSFLVTANWQRLVATLRLVALQAGAITLALGSVALFKL